MMNGCICCTVRDDLIQSLKDLAIKRKGKFDQVLIETTGLADPAPIAQTFFVDETMRELYRLDSIITFVDCKHTPGHLAEVKPDGVENEAVEQVAFADVLVLNKTDLVNEAELTSLKASLKEINSQAQMIESKFSRVPVDQLLDIKAFDLQRTLAMDEEFLDTEGEHMHDTAVSSVGICIEGSFKPNEFMDWLRELLMTKGQDIYRSKGVIALQGSDERYVFQGVHMMLRMQGSQDPDAEEEGEKLPDWAPGEKRMNKLCFIGKNLNRKELQQGLEDCIFNGKYPEPGPIPTDTLRFKAGDKVMVKVGTWERGVVVKQWYRELAWPTGRYVPYMVMLEDESCVWAPRDSDVFIRVRDATA